MFLTIILPIMKMNQIFTEYLFLLDVDWLLIVGAGGFVRVNSRHQIGVLESDKSHQLISSAWSLEDGVVEAVQHATYHTAFGVQFLPDTRLEIPPHFDRLFENLIYDVNHTI